MMRVNKTRAVLSSVIFFFLITAIVSGQQADNENGTYTNPVIWSDFPDNDVIRVGDTYYMVTTTMHVFPGVTIQKSKDLVNWEYAANALPRLDIHPYYNLDGGTRYSHGQWATSIRYHNGLFYLLFVTMDEGGFLMTAADPESEWKLQKLVRPYYDPGSICLCGCEDGRREEETRDVQKRRSYRLCTGFQK